MPSFDETVKDALTTIRLVPRWHLRNEDWPAVEQALREVYEAVKSQDALAVHRAARELEGFGPTRLAAITRTTDLPAPPPEPVLDLVNTLVHPGGGWGAVGSSTPEAHGSDPGRGA